jgi:hypothetical protein
MPFLQCTLTVKHKKIDVAVCRDRACPHLREPDLIVREYGCSHLTKGEKVLNKRKKEKAA